MLPNPETAPVWLIVFPFFLSVKFQEETSFRLATKRWKFIPQYSLPDAGNLIEENGINISAVQPDPVITVPAFHIASQVTSRPALPEPRFISVWTPVTVSLNEKPFTPSSNGHRSTLNQSAFIWLSESLLPSSFEILSG